MTPGAVVEWLRRPSTGVLLVVLALSSWMVSRAVENWLFVHWVADTKLARAPLPFGQKVPLGAELPRGRAVLLVRSDAATRACDGVKTMATDTLLVLVVGETRSYVAHCAAPLVALDGIAVTDSLHGALSAALKADDFALLDRSARVVYGSGRLDDVRLVPRTLSLLGT